MSDSKSFWLSIETKDEDSIKLGNLNIKYKLNIKYLSKNKFILSTIEKKIVHKFKKPL